MIDIVMTASVLSSVAAIAKLWFSLKEVKQEYHQIKNDYDLVWSGIIGRGFVEAEKVGVLLKKDGNGWVTSDAAKVVYAPIKPTLKNIRAALIERFGKEPSNEILAFAIEEEYQKWMLLHACPELGINQHGCLAVACILAREDEKK